MGHGHFHRKPHKICCACENVQHVEDGRRETATEVESIRDECMLRQTIVLLACEAQQAFDKLPIRRNLWTSEQIQQFQYCRADCHSVREGGSGDGSNELVKYSCKPFNRTIIDVNSSLLLLQTHIRLIKCWLKLCVRVLNSLWPLINLLAFYGP